MNQRTNSKLSNPITVNASLPCTCRMPLQLELNQLLTLSVSIISTQLYYEYSGRQNFVHLIRFKSDIYICKWNSLKRCIHMDIHVYMQKSLHFFSFKSYMFSFTSIYSTSLFTILLLWRMLNFIFLKFYVDFIFCLFG